MYLKSGSTLFKADGSNDRNSVFHFMSAMRSCFGSRVSFTLLLGALWCSKSLAGSHVGDKSGRTYKPHILLVVMDDLGSNDLGFHQSNISTPHCDSLLGMNGAIYLDNYYVLPSCSPTRSALFSGRYPLHTGIHHWLPASSTAGLPLEDETIADMLHRANYTTHAIGKWHLGFSQWEQTPTFRGFDSFYGFYSGGEDYFSHVAASQGYDMRHDQHPRCGPECTRIVNETGNYSTHVFTREAIRVIEEYSSSMTIENRQNRPLFLYLAFQAVHNPDQVPEHYKEQYSSSWPDNPRRQTYAGMLTAADEGIGNVAHALQTAGLWDDTLLIFTTDNGGPTATCAVQGSSNYPKRGGKCSVWEGGTRGDGFVSGLAVEKLGLNTDGGPRRLPNLFHVVDWLPTLADIVNVVPAANKPLDGKSQWLALMDDKVSVRDEVFVGYTHNDETNEWYGPALRYQNWKLVQGSSGGPDQYDQHARGNPDDPQEGGIANTTYLLYDLETDREELQNLATLYPNVVEKLRQKLQEYQQTYTPPQPSSTVGCPSCPGPVKTFMGPTWMPWCKGSSQIVVYE
ncbi:arylsulfatase [Nitzschia inconspicua]|uniref:Arylsulfatase n=1 Tax=Nitzschia inconspicua TaxID=303405 RepID=A0A9K3KJ23_9STRA|nr:arylsulfatase [Nitzschia inconspicua]